MLIPTAAAALGAAAVRVTRPRWPWVLAVDRSAGLGLLRLRWEERGGPGLTEPPARRGFGSRVIEATVADRVGGRVERRWEAPGLVCAIAVPLGRVLAQDRCAVRASAATPSGLAGECP
jgi:hypothetical protein